MIKKLFNIDKIQTNKNINLLLQKTSTKNNSWHLAAASAVHKLNFTKYQGFIIICSQSTAAKTRNKSETFFDNSFKQNK